MKFSLAQWGNQLYSGERTYAIVPKRRMWLTISAAAMLLCVVVLGVRGLNFGVDFTGGTVYQVSDPANPDPALAFAVDIEVHRHRAPAHRRTDPPPDLGLERIIAGRHAQADIEPARIDALHIHAEGEARDASRAAAEAGHAGE